MTDAGVTSGTRLLPAGIVSLRSTMQVVFRRRIRGIAATLMVGVAGVTASCSGPLGVGPEPSCACASLQTEVPWPVSAASAKQAALEVLGAIDIELGRSSQEPVHVFIASGHDRFALIDGDTGKVAEIVIWPALSVGGTPRISPRQAQDAAIAFLESHPDLRAPGTANITTSTSGLDHVTWIDAGATSAEITINTDTGTVASFVDLRAHSGLVAPILAADAAMALAIAAFAVPGEQATSQPEFRVEIDPSGRQRTIWSIGLGIPSATEADVYLQGGLVEVDAATGATSIVKK